MTVGEMMSRMSAREYDDWMVFMSRYPIGERAAFLRAGTVAAMLVNVQPQDPKQARRPVYGAADVFPWIAGEGEPEAETSEQTFARMSAGFMAIGPVIAAPAKDG